MMPTAMPNISAFSPSSLFICKAAKEMLPRSRMARKYSAITNHISRIATLRMVVLSTAASAVCVVAFSIVTSVMFPPAVLFFDEPVLSGQTDFELVARDPCGIDGYVDLDRAGQG